MPMDNIITTRIKQLAEGSPLGTMELAEQIGVAAPTLSRYFTGTRSPDMSTAIKFAEYFHVSMDWLCGLSDEKHPEDYALRFSKFYPLMTSEEQAIIDIIVSKYEKGDT